MTLFRPLSFLSTGITAMGIPVQASLAALTSSSSRTTKPPNKVATTTDKDTAPSLRAHLSKLTRSGTRRVDTTTAHSRNPLQKQHKPDPAIRANVIEQIREKAKRKAVGNVHRQLFYVEDSLSLNLIFDRDTGNLVEKDQRSAKSLIINVSIFPRENRLEISEETLASLRTQIETATTSTELSLLLGIMDMDSLPIIDETPAHKPEFPLLTDNPQGELVVEAQPTTIKANLAYCDHICPTMQTTYNLSLGNSAILGTDLKAGLIYLSEDGEFVGDSLSLLEVQSAKGTVRSRGMATQNAVEIVVKEQTILRFGGIDHLTPKQRAAIILTYGKQEAQRTRVLEKYPYALALIDHEPHAQLAQDLSHCLNVLKIKVETTPHGKVNEQKFVLSYDENGLRAKSKKESTNLAQSSSQDNTSPEIMVRLSPRQENGPVAIEVVLKSDTPQRELIINIMNHLQAYLIRVYNEISKLDVCPFERFTGSQKAKVTFV
jgi:hypothetical protein